MYCHHCGADGPEIIIGNRSFCSACGLPLGGKEEQEISEIPPAPLEIKKQGELDRAFQTMSGNLSGEGEVTSYKSSDLSMVGSRNKSEDTAVPVAEEPSKQPPAGQATSNITADNPVLNAPVIDIPVDTAVTDNIEITKENISTEKEAAFKKALEEQIEEELKISAQIPKEIEEIAVKVPETDIRPREELQEAKYDNIKPNLKPEKNIGNADVRSVEIKSVDPAIPTDKIRADKDESLPTVPSEKESEIKSLGAASKLLDILEKNEKGKEKSDEREKLTDTLKGAERLIDILKDIPEEKRVKKKDTNNTFEANPLANEKEISSPLDTLEIELDKDDFEKEMESDDRDLTEYFSKENLKKEAKKSLRKKDLLEEKLPDLTEILQNHESQDQEIEDKNNLGGTPEKIDSKPIDSKPIEFDPKDIKIEAENIEEPGNEEPTNSAPEIPVDPVDIVTDWENEEGDFGEESENDQDSNTNDEQGEDTHEDTLAVDEKKLLEEEIGEIHGLGEKRGHIDHWPDEEVKRIDTEELKDKDESEHPLTSYFKNALGTKELKQGNIKKKKEKKKRNFKPLKIIFSFLLSLVLIFGIIFTLSKLPGKDFETEKQRALQNINFNFLEPKYLPIGLTGQLPIQKDSSSISVSYAHVADNSRQIEIKESSIFLSEEEILQLYIKKNTTTYTEDILNDSKVYYYSNNAIFTKDKIIIYVSASYDIDQTELRKIVEAML